jgi:hypothetical protein
VIIAAHRSGDRSIVYTASTLTLYRLCAASRSATSAPHQSGDQCADLRRPDPLPDPGAAARADLRPDRLRHGANPYPAPGPAVRLLRLDGCAQAGAGNLSGAARAFRWRRLLEESEYSSVVELADAEKINKSYVSRVLRLSLLAPPIIEAILNGRQPPTLGLPMLLEPLPVEWEAQHRRLMDALQIDT